MRRTRDAEAELNLPPGFRFHPTDEELVVHYLCRKAACQRLPVPIIAEVDLYKYDPWELPEKALFGKREWYFFTPRDRKYPNGSRPNRAAGSGYWKATGADKPVAPAGSSRPLAIKKALVFYHGKAPRGVKTDWIMHEYRLADTNRSPSKKGGLRLDDWVLCRLYNKKNSWEKMQLKKEAMEASETNDDTTSDSTRTPESDIEHEGFPEFGEPDLVHEGIQDAKAAYPYQHQPLEKLKEENDWFVELNLDELQNPFAGIGSLPVVDVLNQDYYLSSFASPNLKSKTTMSDPATLPPGFRFHPTDEELILHYLRNQAASLPCPVSIIAEVDIYKFDPWELPAKARFGEQEWYFFSPRDRKYPNGVRPNRAAASGYWKATGTDKPIYSSRPGAKSEHVGVKKALVFYRGKPPKGRKTNWIMHEYRLAEARSTNTYRPVKFSDTSMRLDDWVLCRIYKKHSHLQSVPPLVDQEQEQLVRDNGGYFLSNFHQSNEQQQTLQKSFSVSDFLEGFSAPCPLFDNMPETHGSDLGLLMGAQPSLNQLVPDNNNNNSSSSFRPIQQTPHEESPASAAAKRPRIMEPYLDGMNGLLPQLKKPNNEAAIYAADFSNQFDSSLMNQRLYNQQILLNSHLGLH
ncbi:hypothetical protein Cni_G23522 [Canna indica]|uniref:NAC domain-containing protein n=1 Tax=Canna indica TaxID=4628 RepID=A0AAQ3KYQ2_9LILI|nr:hypothetical protein Cni_G23522 [Canna indica]